MRSRDKQNKHKLKFNYITQLKMLGKILKEHSSSVNTSISKNDKNYNNEVVKLMSNNMKKEYCSILDKCDDISMNLTNLDSSLKKSHKKFSMYKKIISE